MPPSQDPYRRAAQEQADAEALVAQQQRTAERLANAQAKQAAREQKAAADAARKAELSRQELDMRAKGMVPVTTADGNLHEDPLFEQKQAEKAAKADADLRNKQSRADLTRKGIRHSINPVDGSPIAHETEADVAARVTAAEQAKRRQKYDDEIRALETEHDYTRAEAQRQGFKPLPRNQAGERPLETKALPSLKQQALFGLQAKLQQQAKATDKAGFWDVVNNNPTPEAQAAQERLARLSQPGADLTEDDLAELELDDATKPTVAKIRDIQAKLAKDDELSQAASAHQSRIASLKLRRDAPEKWLEAERRRRAALPPEELAKDLETTAADLTQRRAALEERASTLNSQLSLHAQQLDTIEQEATQRRQQGITAGEIVTYTLPDGTTEAWPQDLAAKREEIHARLQDAEAMQQDDWTRLRLDEQDLQAEASLLDEAATRLNEVNKVSQVQQAQSARRRFQFTPGMEQTGPELDALASEAQTRQQVLAEMHPDGIPQEALDALNADIQSKTDALISAGEANLQGAAQAAAQIRQRLDAREFEGKDASPAYAEAAAQLAQQTGTTPEEAQRLITDAESATDWSNTYGRHGEGDTPGQTRLLSNGGIVVNPSITDKAAYEKAVAASGATPEAQADAIARYPQVREAAARQVLESIQEIGSVFGPGAIADYTAYAAKRPGDLSEAEWAMRYVENEKANARSDTWNTLKSITREAWASLNQGAIDLRQQASGLLGGLTGSETLMQDAQWAGRKAEALQQAKVLSGDQSTNVVASAAFSSIPRLAVSILPAAGGAKAIAGGVRLFAGTALGSRLFPSLAAAIEGSATPAQAAKAVDTLTRAGLGGASAAGAAQTYGAQIADIYGTLRREHPEMSHAEALQQAQVPAIISGLATAALTTLGGSSGVERLFTRPQEARAVFDKVFASRLQQAGFVGKEFLKGGLKESFLEELPDEMISQIAAAVGTGHSVQQAIADYLRSLPELALATTALGGAGQGIEAARESSVQAAATAQAPSAIAPEILASAEAAIDSLQLPDVDEATLARTQDAARGVLYIAQGTPLTEMDAETLAALDIVEDPQKPGTFVNGRIVPGKNGIPEVQTFDAGQAPVANPDGTAGMRPVRVRLIDGQPVISQATLDKLGQILPAVRAAIPLDEKARLQQLQPPAGNPQTGPQQSQPAAAAGAPPNAGSSSQESPVQTPADNGTQPARSGDAPSQSSAPVTQQQRYWFSNGVSVRNMDDLVANGGGVVQVQENGRAVAFDKFALTIDGDSAEVAFVEINFAERGKGLGKNAYIALGKELASRGITLQSSKAQYADGNKLWKSLAAEGLAVRGAQGVYRFTAPQGVAASTSPRPQVSPSPSLDPAAQQRAAELATLLEDRGLTAPQAAHAARKVVEAQGIVGASAEEQYAAGIDDELYKLGWIKPQTRKKYEFFGRGTPPTGEATTQPPQSQNKPTENPPLSQSESDTFAPTATSKQTPAPSIPQGDLADRVVVAKQRAMKAVPVASRKRFVKFVSPLTTHLARFQKAFPGGIVFTDGQSKDDLNYTGAGISVANASTSPRLDVNLAELFQSADHLEEKDLAAFTRRAVMHEVRHLAALKVITPSQARALWKDLTPALQARVYASYYAADLQNATGGKPLSQKQLLSLAQQAVTGVNPVNKVTLPKADPFHMAHEFLRMLDEDAEFAGQTSEAMDASPALGQAILDFLRSVLDEIKRLIATELDQSTRVQLREFQKLVEAARKQILADNPADRLGSTKEASAAPLTTAADSRAGVTDKTDKTPVRTDFNPVRGSTGTAYTDSNDAIEFQWAVADVNSLNISNLDNGRINPDYPQELQPRDRTSAASEAQVNDIAKNFNLDRLSASSSVGDGAPIVGPDTVVESGNGRVMGARRAHATGKPSAEAYRAALIARAGEFGLNAEQIEAVPNPVLIRIRTTEVNRTAFVLAANVSTIAPKREMEQAKIDSKQIVPDLFDSFVPAEDGEIFTAANADFIRGFVSAVIPPAERGQVIDASGNLSQTGLRRIRNALFVHAYGTSPEALNALGRLTESIEASDTALARALLAMAPRFAEQNARIASGALYPFSITENLAQALQKLADLRARGEKVETWLAQDRIPGIGDDPGPVTTALVQFLHDNRQRPRQILDALDRYAKALDGAGDPRQISLFGDEKPDALTLWKLAASYKEPALAMGSKTIGPVWHASPNTFDQFNTEGEGAHFGTREQSQNLRGKGKLKIKPYYLSIQNPLRVPDLGVFSNFNNVFSFLSREDFITPQEADDIWGEWNYSDIRGWEKLKTTLQSHGYDGFVYSNEVEGAGDSYVAFHHQQITPAKDVLAKASTTPSLPVSSSPPLAPQAALKLYRKLTAQQAEKPLTGPQSQALERAERSLGQLFLFDEPNKTLKPAEDLVLEQQTASRATFADSTPEQLRLFMATKKVLYSKAAKEKHLRPITRMLVKLRAGVQDALIRVVQETVIPQIPPRLRALMDQASADYNAWLKPRMAALKPQWDAYKARYTPAIVDAYNDKLEALAADLDVMPMTRVPLKGDRGMEKAILDAEDNSVDGIAPPADVTSVNDVLRASLVASDDEGVARIVAALRSRFKVVKFKDRFTKPAGGYHDWNFIVEVAPGLNAEVQVHRIDYLFSKEIGPGHLMYEDWRRLNQLVKKNPAPEIAQLHRRLSKAMEGYYTAIAQAFSISWKAASSISTPSLSSREPSAIGRGTGDPRQVIGTGGEPSTSQVAGSPSTSKNFVDGENVSGIFTPEDTTETPDKQAVRITTANIDRYAGNVDVSALQGRQKDWRQAFDVPAKPQMVPLAKLVSPKNELEDPKFKAGLKKDPRQNAADWILKAMHGEPGAKKRAPLDVSANPDGTYTIQDGNATAQALMLAGWKALPVNEVNPVTLAKASTTPDRFQQSYGSNATLRYPFTLAGRAQEVPVTIWNNIPTPGDEPVIAAELSRLGNAVYRISVVNPSAPYSQVEKFRISEGFPQDLGGSFDKLTTSEIENNAALNDRARRLWESVQAGKDQLSLFKASTSPRLPISESQGLFDFNTGLGLDTLLTPRQKEAKITQSQQLDLFGGLPSEKSRPAPPRPARPARSPRTASPAEQPAGFGELFAPGMAGTGPGSRNPLGDTAGQPGSRGGSGNPPTGGSSTGPSGTDTPAADSPPAGDQRRVPGMSGVGQSALVERPGVGSPDRNFEVPAEVESLAPSTDKAKILANLEAIRLLKQLEAELRNATPEEKKKLAAYTGWGAFKEAFNSKYEKDIADYWDSQPTYKRQYMPDWLQSWEKNHRPLHKLLRENMSEDEFASASASTLNAHYTAAPIIRSMWKMVERLGFKGGRALEPSAGAGHYLGLTPASIADRTQWQTVELDDLSARLLSKLYPEAVVNESQPDATRAVTGLGFERARIPNGSLDLIISNVPFHKSGPRKKGFPNLNLHNFFFAHALDKVKPGGLVAFITSESTMQNNMKQRDFIASKGDLVAAFRLPNNAFKGNAGTEVTTDIIIIRKPDGTPFQGKAWRNLVEVGRQTITLTQGKEQTLEELRAEAARTGTIIGKEHWKNGKKAIDVSAPILVNEYFVNHPQHALGTHTLASTMYRAGGYALVAPDGLDVPAALDALVPSLPENVMGTQQVAAKERRLADREDKPFSFKEQDGKIFEVQPDGSMEEADWSTNPAMVKTWRSWKGVSDAVENLVTRENSPAATDEELAALRRRLNVLYDTHIATHKPISRRFSNAHKHLYSDPAYPLTAALENEAVTVDTKTGKKTYTYKKADIFTRRIGRPIVIPTSAKNLDDALEMSLAWKGHIDPAYGSSLLDISPEAFTAQALEKPDVFLSPSTGLLETAEEYLTGNVRLKLEAAEAAALDDPKFQRNVEALRKAQPERKEIARISPVLGARWIPAEVYASFIKDVLHGNDTVEYIPAGNSWIISGSGLYKTEEHGTERKGPASLFKHALDMTEPMVYDGSGENRTFNATETAAAKTALDKMRRAFIDYVKTSDTQITVDEASLPVWEAVENAFNETQNSFVTPSYVGNYLQFPGLNTDYVYTRAHRRSVIARFLATRRGMMAHGVGSGKTFNQIILAQEMRRLGLAKKPVIVVQNSTLVQFAKSYLKAYPSAKILVPTKRDFEAQNRKKLVAKIATGNWDAVILPHSQFDLISNKPEAVKAYMDSQIDELMGIVGRTRDRAKVRDLEGMLRRLRDRRQDMLDKLAARQDTAVMWEDLGIDALIMDEAHNYKSLPIVTRMGRVKGVPASSNSQRAINFMLKCRDVQAKTGGKNIFLATGTPIKNSMAEAYIMMQFMAPDVLEQFGIYNFDDFATSYGQTVTEAEMAWGGTPKMETRFAKFQNGASLVTMIRSMFDVAFGNEALGLDVPKIKGGEPEMVIVPATPQIDQFNAWTRSVDAAWKAASAQEKEEFTAVPIQTMAAGIAAAVDPRLISPGVDDHPQSKVNTALRRVLDIYKDGTAKRTTQIIFSDLRNKFSMDYLMPFTGHPFPETGSDGEFDLYKDIKAKLISAGVPEKEVHLMQSGMTDVQKAALFEKVDNGEIRIIIGSTELLGVGVNIQTRLKAVHHLMPPRDFTPAMMEQRNGRIIRQGNLHAAKVEGQPAWNEEVEVVNYGTAGSMDSAIYGTLARKQRFITQLLMAENVQDTFDDPTDPVAVNMAEMAARTLGDPDFIRRIELEKEIKELRLQADAFTNELAGKRSRLARLDALIANRPAFIADLEARASKMAAVWTRIAPRPEGIKQDTDISDKAVYQFGGPPSSQPLQTIDTAAKDGGVLKPLDTWLAEIAIIAERRGMTRLPVGLTINGHPFTLDVQWPLPGQPVPGDILDASGQPVTSFKGATSLIQNLRRLADSTREQIATLRQDTDTARQQAEALRAKLANVGTFPDAQRLAELEAEAKAVEERLREKSSPPPTPSSPADATAGLPDMQPVDPDLMTPDVESVIDNADIKGDPRPYLGLAPMPEDATLAKASTQVYTPTSYDTAAPDPFTGFPSLITGSRLSREQGRAIGHAHAQRLRAGLSARPDNGQAGPALAASRAGTLSVKSEAGTPARNLPPVPVLSNSQFAKLQKLPLIGEGAEAKVYADRATGVVYKVLQGYAPVPGVIGSTALGVWPQVYYTSGGRLDYAFAPAERPRQLAVRLAVQTLLGGTPTEIVGIAPEGHIILKQPLSPAPEIGRDEDFIDNSGLSIARNRAGLVEIPKALLADPDAPRTFLAVVEGRPWLLMDLHPDNFVGDNQAQGRINDAIVGQLTSTHLTNIPGLAQLVKDAAARAQALGDRSDRLFKATTAVNPVTESTRLPDIPAWSSFQKSLAGLDKPERDTRTAAYHQQHPDAQAALDARKAAAATVGRPIPPAWTEVQIFPPGSRLLAKGRDDKGRLQSIYSSADTQASLAAKFARQKRVNALMPRILDGVKDGLRQGTEEASVLRLIYLTGFRNGGEGDTGAKVKAYGATTLLAEHVTITGDTVSFDFTGKLGVRQQHDITDAGLAADLRARKARGGRLFNTSPDKVLAALRRAAGTQDIKVHDLRTWNATSLAAELIKANPTPETETDYWLKRDQIADVVARKLGDTRKIVLESYIDPIVFAKWQESLTLPHDSERPKFSRKSAAARGTAGQLQRPFEDYERSLRDELLPSPGEGGWPARDGGLTLFKASTAGNPVTPVNNVLTRAKNLALDTLEGSFAAASAVTRATGAEAPLAKLGWNHLDRALSAKLAALARWTDGRTGATQTVAKWTNATPQKLRDAAHALKREFFPDSVLPREILAKKREMEIKTAMGSQKAMDLVRALQGSPKFSTLAYPPGFAENPTHRRHLYEAMTGERDLATLPKELQDLAAKLRAMLVEIGREAVKQGRMSVETFDNLRTTYMPHFYEEDVQKEKSIFQRFRLGVRDILAQRTTAWHIEDTAQKDSTGQPRLVSHTGNQWRFRNQQHMDAFFEDFIQQQALAELQSRYGKKFRSLTAADLMTPSKLDAEVRGRLQEIKRTLHQRYKRQRPLTIAEQEKAGLIMDPVYAIARYAAQMAHDNSTAEFFNHVAAQPALVSDIATPGFTEIPDNPRFGRLAGKFVENDVAGQLLELIEAPGIALKIYDTVLGWWKTGKTVLNPGTHVRNVLGNLFFSQLAGNSVWNPGNATYYRQALSALRQGGPVLTEAYDAGVLGADFVSAELRQTLRQLLPDPATIVDDGKAPTFLMGIGKAIGRFIGTPAGKAYNNIAALYQAEDEIFKLAAYLKTKSMLLSQSPGLPVSESARRAAEHVRHWFPYFDSGTSGTLKLLGRTAMPFLGFYRESIRIFGHALKERPIALAAGLSVPSFVTFLSAMALGLDDDDLEEIQKDMRGKAGKLLGPTPLEGMPLFSMLLPVRSDTGQVQQFDISAVHPFVDFLGNRVESSNQEDWWQKTFRSFIAAGPIGSLLYSQMTGRDAFGDRPFVEANMTGGEKAAARLDNAAKTLLPPLAPGGTGFATLMNAGERSTNKTLEVRSPTQAAVRVLGGLDVRNATPDLYRLADDWRKAHGYEVTEGMDYGSTTPASRARKALFDQLAQDNPNPAAVKNILTALDKMGHPVRTEQDVNKLLFYRDPLKLIGGNKAKGITAPDAQAQFRASLKGEARAALENALQEYQRIKATAPSILARARTQ